MFVDTNSNTSTKRSAHVPVCNAFLQFAGDTAEAMLIHEWLHIAGQREDTNSTYGPNDPPNSDQIQRVVGEACDVPQIIDP